jgi:hypothetical protein
MAKERKGSGVLLRYSSMGTHTVLGQNRRN